MVHKLQKRPFKTSILAISSLFPGIICEEFTLNEGTDATLLSTIVKTAPENTLLKPLVTTLDDVKPVFDTSTPEAE